MSAENLPGHHCGAGADDGGYQFPALAPGAGARVIDLTAWAGRYVEIQWAGKTDLLYYGFFETQALADTGFDTATATADHGNKVNTAPGWVNPASDKQGRVPKTRTFLRLQPVADTARCLVRQAEGDPAEVA